MFFSVNFFRLFFLSFLFSPLCIFGKLAESPKSVLELPEKKSNQKEVTHQVIIQRTQTTLLQDVILCTGVVFLGYIAWQVSTIVENSEQALAVARRTEEVCRANISVCRNIQSIVAENNKFVRELSATVHRLAFQLRGNNVVEEGRCPCD